MPHPLRISSLAACALALGLPASAQFVDPFSGYTGQNLLLEGSSFEVGLDGFGFGRRMYHSTNPDRDYRPLEFETRASHVAHGKRSLEIVNELEDYARVEFHWMELAPGKITVSLWARAEKGRAETSTQPMVLTVKVQGNKVNHATGTLLQESFALTEQGARHAATFTYAADDVEDDLAWLELYTGPWKSSLAPGHQRRIHGTIWVDAVQVAAGTESEYELATDERVEIGAWGEDFHGPRTGNLFAEDDDVIRARVRLWSDDYTGPVELEHVVLDTTGAELARGTSRHPLVDGLETDVVLRSRFAPPDPEESPGPFGVPWLAPKDPPGEVDLLRGRKGVFKVVLTAKRPRTGAVLGTEELTLAVIERDTSGPNPGSPFGVHVHFLTEGTADGYPVGDDHEHVVETSLPQEFLFGAMRDAGFKWVRDFSFASWAAIQPTQSDWITNDHTLDWCEAYDLELFPILGWTSPNWARSGVTPTPIVNWQTPREPVDAGYFETFVQTIAQQYAGRVIVWEIGNEPYFYYGVDQYHDHYLAPAKAAVDQVQGFVWLAGPGGGIQHWVKEPATPDGNFTEQLFDFHAGGDALTFVTEHWYAKKDPPFEDGFEQNPDETLRGRIDHYGATFVGSNIPGSNTVAGQWDSESAHVMPTLRSDTRFYGQDNRVPPNFNAKGFHDGMSADFDRSNLTASYFVRQYVIELAHGVQRFFVHTLHWGIQSPANVGGQRLLEPDGTPNHAFVALNGMMTRLRGVTPSGVHKIEGGEAPNTGSVFAYTFDRGGIPVSVIWDWEEDGSFPTLDIDLDPANVRAFDMMGNELALAPSLGGGFDLPLGNLPCYLEGDGTVVDFTALTAALEDATAAVPVPAD